MRKVKFRLSRWHHHDYLDHLLCILQGFGELLDGVVSVGSLGFLMSNFEMEICFWRTYLHIRRLKKAREPQA